MFDQTVRGATYAHLQPVNQRFTSRQDTQDPPSRRRRNVKYFTFTPRVRQNSAEAFFLSCIRQADRARTVPPLRGGGMNVEVRAVIPNCWCVEQPSRTPRQGGLRRPAYHQGDESTGYTCRSLHRAASAEASTARSEREVPERGLNEFHRFEPFGEQ